MRDAHTDLKPSLVLFFSFCVCSWLCGFQYSGVLFKPIIIINRNKNKMVDLQPVCCMCGDVGFPDKLFRCSKCRNRFQHSYCSNYYSEHAEPIQACDWCQCEERSSSSRNNTNKSTHANEVRSVYSGDKIKQHSGEEGGSSAEKAVGKTPSPRPTTRRYKLLKDVMC